MTKALHAAWQRALEPLGLDAHEEAAYGALLYRASASAGELAAILGVQRNQAYRIADRMVEHGIARRLLERPVRYVAEPLDAILQRMELEAALRMSQVHQLRRHVAQHPPPRPAGQSSLDVLQGRPRAYQEVARLVGEAVERIEIMDTHPQAWRHMKQAGIVPSLSARAAAGLELRSILQASPRDASLTVRVLPDTPANMRWVLRDRQEAVLFVETAEGHTFRRAGDRAVRTHAPDMVGMLGWMFDRVWDQSADPEAG